MLRGCSSRSTRVCCRPRSGGASRRRSVPPRCCRTWRTTSRGFPTRPMLWPLLIGAWKRKPAAKPPSRMSLIDRIRASVIGDDAVLDGPFGPRRLVYADSHGLRPLARRSSRTSSATRCCRCTPTRTPRRRPPAGTRRRCARTRARIIHRAVNGGDGRRRRVLRLGRDRRDRQAHPRCSTSTPRRAAGRLHRALRAPLQRAAVARVGRRRRHDPRGRRRAASTSSTSSTSSRRHADRALKIGSFSAASNVTGIVTDVDRVAIALHRHGALSCWDYAAAGPYLPIDMNAAPDIPTGTLAYKDAVFLSPHKFVGGPGTPGVLVAKRALLRNRVPVGAGRRDDPVRQPDRARPTTPTRRSARRAARRRSSSRSAPGSSFALKEAVGSEEIRRREDDFARRALASWGANPQIEILGNPELERLAIVSLGLRHPRGPAARELRRRACSATCSGSRRAAAASAPGPYIHRMYPIDDEWSAAHGRRGRRRATWAPSSRSRGSASTTSSARRSSTTSSRPSTCSPTRAGSCCRSTASIPAAGLWQHRAGDARRRETCACATRCDGAPPRSPPRPRACWPASSTRRGEIIAAVAGRPAGERARTIPPLSADFERIRWFPLPGEGLAQLRSGRDARGSSYEATGPRARSSRRTRWTLASIGRSSPRP